MEDYEYQKTIVAQPKYRSLYFWTGIVSLVMMLMGNFGLYERIGISEGFIRDFTNALLTFLASVGVFNDSGNATQW